MLPPQPGSPYRAHLLLEVVDREAGRITIELEDPARPDHLRIVSSLTSFMRRGFILSAPYGPPVTVYENTFVRMIDHLMEEGIRTRDGNEAHFLAHFLTRIAESKAEARATVRAEEAAVNALPVTPADFLAVLMNTSEAVPSADLRALATQIWNETPGFAPHLTLSLEQALFRQADNPLLKDFSVYKLNNSTVTLRHIAPAGLRLVTESGCTVEIHCQEARLLLIITDTRHRTRLRKEGYFLELLGAVDLFIELPSLRRPLLHLFAGVRMLYGSPA